MYKRLFENSVISPKFNLKSTGREDWDKEILGDPKRFQVKIIKMTPDEFLDKTMSYRYKIDKEKVNKFTREITNNSILPTPTILWGSQGEKGKSAFHDGSHRVLALKNLGIKNFPVLQITDLEY
jgi:hypothetical protein